MGDSGEAEPKYMLSFHSKQQYQQDALCQYDITELNTIWCRVLCKNPVRQAPHKSFLFKVGHLEKWNARQNPYSHSRSVIDLVTTVLCVGFATGLI